MRKSLSQYPRFIKWGMVVVIVLLLLPELLRLVVIHVVSSELNEARIKDIDLNLLTGEIKVKEIVWISHGNNTLNVGEVYCNLNWINLFSGEISVETIRINDVQLAVRKTKQGIWEVVVPLNNSVDGTANAVEDEESAAINLPKLALQNVNINDLSITVNSDVVTGALIVDRVTVNNVSSWRAVSPSLNIVAAWNGAPITLNVTGEHVVQEPYINGDLIIEKFPVDNLSSIVKQKLSGDLNVSLTFNSKQILKGNMTSLVNGTLSLNDFAIGYAAMDVHHKDFLWKGSVQASMIDQALTYSLKGNVKSSGLSIEDNKQKLSLLRWETLSLSNLAMDQDFNVNIEQFSVFDVDMMSDIVPGNNKIKQGQLYTGAVKVSDIIMLAGKGVHINSINVEDAQYQLIVQKDGRLQLSSIIESALSNLQNNQNTSEGSINPPETDSSVEKTDKFAMTLDLFEVSGESFVELQDLRFNVPVKEKINIEKLIVKDIDQKDVEKPTTIQLLSRIGEFSQAEVSGEIKPFAEQLNASFSGKLEAIALPNLSSYSEAYLGYHLTTGQYDHQFDIDIDNNELTLNNKLDLRKLTLSAVDPNKPQPMEKLLDVPLDFALNLLRDSDDNISLDVPVKGSLDDPNVKIDSIVSTALGGALKSGASNYLKYAIQPYGAVVMAAQFVGKQVSAITLDPVVQSVGQSELTSKHLDYLNKVATLMTQRPKLTIKLCGQANEGDRQSVDEVSTEKEVQPVSASKDEVTIDPQLEQKLVVLAKKRTDEVKRVFIDLGVDSQRVFSCQPQYQPQAISGVMMAM